ncbi:MAG: zinc-ribbon domain-containing protein [Candidatus Thermoplasmatota archaeon]
MKYCTKCGIPLPDDAKFCGKCGQPIGLTCPSCGRAVVEGTRYCIGCGTDLEAAFRVSEKVERLKEYQPPPITEPPYQRPAHFPPYQPVPYRPTYQFPTQPIEKKSAKPTAAGILLLIAGIITLVYTSIMLWITPSMLQQAGQAQSIPISQLGMATQVIQICYSVIIILGIFALIGGIVALRRKLWGLALTGSILGLFTIGPILICSILSLVALILIAISREEFKR